tara:strand:+ start:1396 stop:1548 length:153 start_codon:yes stop_codon:yes gene_type:complete
VFLELFDEKPKFSLLIEKFLQQFKRFIKTNDFFFICVDKIAKTSLLVAFV